MPHRSLNTSRLMKYFFPLLFLLVFPFMAIANDGVYWSSGGVIYPIQESRITLDKEILTFKVDEDLAHVNIEFTFINLDESPKTLLVGFQAPFPSGDVQFNIQEYNPIQNFTIMSQGAVLPYRLMIAECEDCVLQRVSDIKSSDLYSGVYVYLFEITFAPGVNKINHSYSFRASSSVYMEEMYDYILTTGSKWAGGKIRKLEMNFDLGDNQFFYVNDIFGENADWSIIGTGIVTDEKFGYDPPDTSKMVRILSGFLKISVHDFNPTKNIHFGIINRNSFISYPVYAEKIQSGEVITTSLFGDPSSYSKSELRIKRNTIYAQHGYVFSSPDLQEYFSQFGWYIPNPNLKMDDIQLTTWEREFIAEVQEMEER
ncbi:YARHG domain-containing protein [Phaeocystidibacter marisrubri]|uniref:YARHG domain-containing protein n=2 Tax=Phaeocystidibacter marisrubri TaxID=1577780 RepID=A0A6L3ZI37_9FLAO|nr:YARHG domain-containing protein [Phaeocystidibacter marisrubri]